MSVLSPLASIPQFSRNARRFKEIVYVLGRYGLADWMSRTDPKFFKSLFRSAAGEIIADQPSESRIRMALTELGPTFIKLGQILSTRPDLVGPRLAAELASLQDRVPADPPLAVHEIIAQELGRPAADLFGRLDETPLASASIGQVHRGQLKDGREVVVKVRHVGIEQTVENDLEILDALAALAEKHEPALRTYQPQALVAEFSRTLRRELDFRREARNLEEFNRNFRDDDTVRIPLPYMEFSSRRVLTMEALHGLSIANAEKLRQAGIDSRALAEKGSNVFLTMVFRDGFYHADPHPGNLWVRGCGGHAPGRRGARRRALDRLRGPAWAGPAGLRPRPA